MSDPDDDFDFTKPQPVGGVVPGPPPSASPMSPSIRLPPCLDRRRTRLLRLHRQPRRTARPWAKLPTAPTSACSANGPTRCMPPARDMPITSARKAASSNLPGSANLKSPASPGTSVNQCNSFERLNPVTVTNSLPHEVRGRFWSGACAVYRAEVGTSRALFGIRRISGKSSHGEVYPRAGISSPAAAPIGVRCSGIGKNWP